MTAPELIHQLYPLLLRKAGVLSIDEDGAKALCTRWMSGKTGPELYDLLRECLIIVQGITTLRASDDAVKDMHRLFIEPIGDALLSHARGDRASARHGRTQGPTQPPMGAAFNAQRPSGGVALRKG